jgi:protein-tyrosine phosphatase
VTVSPPAQKVFTVLLLCTGNICRSAFAERLGRAYIDDQLGNDARAVRIVSAGMHAVVGSAMHPDSALVLKGYGAEAGDFRARQFADPMAEEADLILTMSRGHRREVLERAPRALKRTFTLREAAGLLAQMGDVVPPGANPADAGRLVASMSAARSGRQASADDDVPDPIGRPIEVHAEVGALIATTLLPVLQRFAELRTH